MRVIGHVIGHPFEYLAISSNGNYGCSLVKQAAGEQARVTWTTYSEAIF